MSEQHKESCAGTELSTPSIVQCPNFEARTLNPLQVVFFGQVDQQPKIRRATLDGVYLTETCMLFPLTALRFAGMHTYRGSIYFLTSTFSS